MPLLTPVGSKPIEQFRVGDMVLSRTEFDPSGPVEAKVVEEVFNRAASELTDLCAVNVMYASAFCRYLNGLRREGDDREDFPR